MHTTVAAFIDAFNEQWGDPDALLERISQLVTEDFTFVERPNFFNPRGSERDAEANRAGIRTGATLLAHQNYEVRGTIEEPNVSVVKMRWTGTLAVDAGELAAGSRLTAWCTAHYELRDDRIARIEQYDCYEPPVAP